MAGSVELPTAASDEAARVASFARSTGMAPHSPDRLAFGSRKKSLPTGQALKCEQQVR